MGDFKELRDAILKEKDEVKKAELQAELDAMHRAAEEESLLDDDNFVEFEK